MAIHSEPATIKLALASASSELCQARWRFALQSLTSVIVPFATFTQISRSTVLLRSCLPLASSGIEHPLPHPALRRVPVPDSALCSRSPHQPQCVPPHPQPWVLLCLHTPATCPRPQRGCALPTMSLIPSWHHLSMLKCTPRDWLPCSDFHALNKATVPDWYPVPHFQDFTTMLYRNMIFTQIDLIRVFHQISVASENILKTAITMPNAFWPLQCSIVVLTLHWDCHSPMHRQSTASGLSKVCLQHGTAECVVSLVPTQAQLLEGLHGTWS